ncbi:hypothetical protein CFRS1_v006528 [Colletotrichum fructicola]|nr:hypothetical protein CFRS1_v006528 [Colletotrichum fructicola]
MPASSIRMLSMSDLRGSQWVAADIVTRPMQSKVFADQTTPHRATYLPPRPRSTEDAHQARIQDHFTTRPNTHMEQSDIEASTNFSKVGVSKPQPFWKSIPLYLGRTASFSRYERVSRSVPALQHRSGSLGLNHRIPKMRGSSWRGTATLKCRGPGPAIYDHARTALKDRTHGYHS